MTKQKILTIAVIVLVILNIGILSFLWMKESDAKKHRTKKKRPNVERYLAKKLALTEDQSKAFNTAREVHFEQTHELMRSVRADRKKLNHLLSDADTLAQQELLNSITDKTIELEKFNFQHLQILRSLCTAEQQVKFDSVIYKVIDKASGMREGKKPRKPKK